MTGEITIWGILAGAIGCMLLGITLWASYEQNYRDLADHREFESCMKRCMTEACVPTVLAQEACIKACNSLKGGPLRGD